MKSFMYSSRMALIVGMLATGTAANAQQADDASVSDIIVTGTRTTGMAAVDSPAPIQLLGSDLLARSAQPDLSATLAQNLPSVQAQSFGTDLQQVNLSFRLRGLSPNHTLILLNGKRRHGTANVSVAGGIYGGAAAPDISFIASDSIDHVEVLQDGAAAQYGTDAVAGVINIIQKKGNSGGSLNFNMGQYMDQYEDGSCPGGKVDHCMATGGKSWSLSGNIGIEPFEGAYLNLSGERRHKGRSVRTHYDARYYDNGSPENTAARNYLARYPDLLNNPTYPYIDQRQGDPEMDISNVMYNAGYEFGDFEIYSFGSYGHKNARALQVFRTPDGTYCLVDTVNCKAEAGSYLVNPLTGPVTTVTPGTTRKLFNSHGYEPTQVTSETDYAFTGGFRGMIGDTSFDIASTYGKDVYNFSVENSANITMYQRLGFTPEEFRIGALNFSQWSNQIDLTHELDIGMDNPLTIAGGLEYRHEKYGMKAGDPSSYYGGGSQSFYGWTAENERIGQGSRNNFSQYLDISLKPTDRWLIDGAIRHEHYSDFGDTTVLKLTSRYDFSDAIALRGTVSTGFRAPTLAESYYAGINVSTNYLSGVFPANGEIVSNLGFGNLKPEKSTNYSLGLVLHPIDRLTITIDGYLIKLRDRIVLGPTLYGYSGGWCPVPAGTPGATAADIAQSTNPNAANYVGPGQGISWDATKNRYVGTGGCQDPASGSSLADYLDSFRLNNQSVIYDVMTSTVSDIPPALLYLNSNASEGRSASGGRGGYLGVQSFVNGLSVRTVGVDVQANYSSNFGGARVNWLLAMNYNKNKITKINPLPSTLYTSELQPAATTLYPDADVITAERPSFRTTVGANLTMGKFGANLRGNYYGKTWARAAVATGTLASALEGKTDLDGNPLKQGGYYKDYTNAAFIVDLELSYQITKALKLAIGANNLFNHYANPTNWDYNMEPKERLGNASTTAMPYRNSGNYGYNGGYYYAKVGVKF